MKAISTLLTLIALVFSYSANASNLDKEQNWVDAVEDNLMDGETLMLDDGDRVDDQQRRKLRNQ